ncbi:MAG: arginine--tRNA ligase [Microthrixaceae bacterium]
MPVDSVENTIRTAVATALGEVGLEGLPSRPAEVHLERPANPDHGDFSTNVALALAKRNGRNPRELAAELVGLLEAADLAHVEGIEIAGPGFVNFRLAPTWLHERIGLVVAEGSGYGRSGMGGGRRVLVEFVSANPTGPVHAGHARGATYGDALARVLEFAGFEVGREFYINDRGVQMKTYADSLAARAAGEDPPEGGYMGAYISEWASEMPEGADPLEWGYEFALAEQRRASVLSTSSSIDGSPSATWSRPNDRDHPGGPARQGGRGGPGRCGVAPIDRLRRRQGPVLVKSDGEFTCLLPDIAYHRDKFSRGWQLLVNVWGADHHGYAADEGGGPVAGSRSRRSRGRDHTASYVSSERARSEDLQALGRPGDPRGVDR